MEIVSSARKLILRPQAGPTVSFPTGVKINTWGNDNTSPQIVVCNGTEAKPSWQGTSHDHGVVIVNEVPEDLANAALDMV